MLGSDRVRLSVSRAPQPLAAVGEEERGNRVFTQSSPALSWVFSTGAALAKTADGNQLREAPRPSARPGPSPAPADTAGGAQGAVAPLPPSAAGPGALARPARLMLSRCGPGAPPPPGPAAPAWEGEESQGPLPRHQIAAIDSD